MDLKENLVEVIAVDYGSRESLAAALTGAHTLLSVILTKDATQAETMVRLLDAAVDSSVKRYVPSYWGVGTHAWDKVRILKMKMNGLWEACLQRERQDQITVARFNHGIHMNYIGVGRRESVGPMDEQKLLEEMRENGGYAEGDDAICQGVEKDGDMADGSGAFLISPSTCTAELPLTEEGEYPLVTMTTIRDEGRFVAAALGLGTWQHDMNVVGDTLPLDQILQLVESATKRNFNMKHLHAEQLSEEIASLQMPQDIMKIMWLELKLMMTRNASDEGYLTPVVNELCPQIKPTSICDYVELA